MYSTKLTPATQSNYTSWKVNRLNVKFRITHYYLTVVHPISSLIALSYLSSTNICPSLMMAQIGDAAQVEPDVQLIAIPVLTRLCDVFLYVLSGLKLLRVLFLTCPAFILSCLDLVLRDLFIIVSHLA